MAKEVLLKRMKDEKGETLAEVLVAILIVTLSTVMFLGMISCAYRISQKGTKADALFYQTMSLLENFEANEDTVSAGSTTLTVEAGDGSVSQPFSVDVFSGNGMVSYRISNEGGTP